LNIDSATGGDRIGSYIVADLMFMDPSIII